MTCTVFVERLDSIVVWSSLTFAFKHRDGVSTAISWARSSSIMVSATILMAIDRRVTRYWVAQQSRCKDNIVFVLTVGCVNLRSNSSPTQNLTFEDFQIPGWSLIQFSSRGRILFCIQQWKESRILTASDEVSWTNIGSYTSVWQSHVWQIHYSNVLIQ